MPRATGTRALAAFFYLTVIGTPIAMALHYHAIQKEKERKQELKNMEKLAENVDSS